eukprot:222778-Alexandrium_andersonii.AAC.1
MCIRDSLTGFHAADMVSSEGSPAHPRPWGVCASALFRELGGAPPPGLPSGCAWIGGLLSFGCLMASLPNSDCLLPSGAARASELGLRSSQAPGSAPERGPQSSRAQRCAPQDGTAGLPNSG